jgi:hypothetical protein
VLKILCRVFLVSRGFQDALSLKGFSLKGFQEALLLKGLKIVFERPWQCAICELLMSFPYTAYVAYIRMSI